MGKRVKHRVQNFGPSYWRVAKTAVSEFGDVVYKAGAFICNRLKRQVRNSVTIYI